MNEEQIYWVLESCALAFSGADFYYLVSECRINKEYARTGLKLFQYLKSKEIKENE